jgi:hypothetical protein
MKRIYILLIAFMLLPPVIRAQENDKKLVYKLNMKQDITPGM